MNNIGNQIYSTYYTANIAANNGRAETFQLLNGNAPFKLKSILFDVRINETVSALPLNLCLNNSQFYALQVGGPLVAVPPITRPFQNFLTPVGIISNGQLFVISRPGQYHFDNFYSTTGMNFAVLMQNSDLILGFTYYWNVICEIENI